MFENDAKVQIVIEREPCPRHDADRFHGCWEVWTLAGPKLPAICNRRALKAGFIGEIDPRSLRKR